MWKAKAAAVRAGETWVPAAYVPKIDPEKEPPKRQSLQREGREGGGGGQQRAVGGPQQRAGVGIEGAGENKVSNGPGQIDRDDIIS